MYMQLSFTAATKRAIIRAKHWADASAGMPEIGPAAMLLGLLAEGECRAADYLGGFNVTQEAVQNHWPNLKNFFQKNADCADSSSSSDCADLLDSSGNDSLLPGGAKPSADLEQSLHLVRNWLAENFQNGEIATEHVLLGLTAADHEVGQWLRQAGMDPQVLREQISQLYGWTPEPSHADQQPAGSDALRPLDVDLDLHGLSLDELFRRAAESPAVAISEQFRLRILRAIDAAANRAREGLRVVEDYVRFLLDDAHLTRLLKQFRHDLAAALAPISPCLLLAARETRGDVGTNLTTASEKRREEPADIPAANISRLEESLRSLEEFTKLVDPEISAKIKQLRYLAYTLHRAVAITAGSRERLAAAKLYVLIDGRATVEEFDSLVRSLVEARVHVIQLRDKRLDDRTLLQRARRLAALTSASPTLFIMNDRADVAALARADGVHVGQEELTLKDARAIVGPEALVGVSTHSIEQAREAVLDGADYIGVGPVFPSGTKQFVDYPGVELLRAVASEISLPAFAIGGIGPENLDAVLAAGFSRIAVSGAVSGAAYPGRAAEELLARLGG